MRKRVGILGYGRSAIPVADRFLAHGYEVMVGTNEKELFIEWFKKSQERGWVGNYGEAARFGDFIVLAASENFAEFLLDMSGAANLHEKTVIDICDPGIIRQFNDDLFHRELFDSLEILWKLQRKYSRIYFVKGFSKTGSLINSGLDATTGDSTLYIFGNSERAKENTGIAFAELGWDCIDKGTLEEVVGIESYADVS